MSWAQLRELADAGWEIGSHTRTHPRLTQLADEELARELGESREASERALGRPCRSFAYPYGDFDARVVKAAERAGYEAGAIENLARASPLAWPRIGIYRPNSMRVFRMKVSPALRRARTALGPVDRAALRLRR
jgi:peptidoglycan/xylan/chitin deacetylase (PgdA/CDA1 family)